MLDATNNGLDKLPKTQVISLTRPKLIYISSNNNKSFVASEFRLNTHLSLCDDGCFDFVDVGGGVQRLKCQRDLVAIHMQDHVGLDEH